MLKKPAVRSTRIIRNGVHAPDAPPAPLEELLAMLKTHPLAPWTTCSPLRTIPGAIFFCGEFEGTMHPFSVLTTDPAVGRRLSEAFTANCECFQVEPETPRVRGPRAGTKHRRKRH
jgi:hypothetical protein